MLTYLTFYRAACNADAV